MSKQLDGIRILDLTRVLSGPYCTMLLADMGAEVIKIEEPLKGDDSRGYPPFDRGISAYFANLNRNKKSIALNLKDPKAKQVLIELIKISDVIVENFKPGTMDKLGFSYEEVKEINPKIIYASISGFGQTGAYSKLPGYDVIAQAMSGIMSVTGWTDSAPTRTGTAIGDILAGLNCCIGILAALQGRSRTGHGERIDISLVDCSVSAMETLIEIFLVEKRVPERIGNRYEFIYPYDSFQAKDGWVVIAVGNDNIWAKFCEAIDKKHLLEIDEFKLNKDRVSEHDRLKAIVSDWTKEHNVEEIIKILLAKGVPCAPINDVAQVVNDKNIVDTRKMIEEIEHPISGKMKIVGSPIKFTESDEYSYDKAPILGLDTESVMKELLGLSSEEVDYFKNRK
ncbi:CaiB/BaiF CoA transferase family protein [Clostridium folliculivorans]|uniref:CaiB/BaiF CoA transferase family protein n=1 Tax=Clostridium folliculivorans TaxID=2886038 RepID=UPI0021C26667|nr:CoA transferase [Clostridium folliculivorans]GKU30456.1 formyl-CoA transferase [Clostridium folliculivorans]